jgi:hypothetical protein
MGLSQRNRLPGRRQVTDGRLAIRYRGVELAYRTFGKIRQVSQTAIVENKQLDAALAFIRDQQLRRKRHRQVVGCWIVKGAMDRSTVVGRRDHAAMATPVTSAQVANAWRRAE